MEDNTPRASVNNPIHATFKTMGDALSRPHPALVDPELRRRSRLLAQLTLAVAGTVVAGIGLLAALFPHMLDDADTLLFFVGTAVFLGTYGLNRAGHYRPAAALTVLSSALVTTVAPFLPGSFAPVLTITVAPVLLAAFVYSSRASVWVAAAVIGAAALLTASVPGIALADYVVTLLFVVIIDAILLVFMFYQQGLDQAHRRELALANAGLRRSEAQLEQRVQARTRELEQARAEAEHANQLKSQFLASVSHELRTPLNAVINFTLFVSSGLYGPVNEQQAGALEKATRSARHLLGIINDVLYMSRIEAGRLDLRPEPGGVALDVELTAVYDVVCAQIGARPIQVSLEVQPDLPAVPGDRQRIRQVLLNLASNAAKYTAAGSIRLRAWQQNDAVLLSVADSGPGIAPEDQDEIFKPFRQLKRSGGSAAGTGLGLAIAHWLVEAHGGRLWVESEPGHGATFYVTLPIDSLAKLDQP
ncbi:MAG: hypothetical protein KC425_11000 [Anaerolineales bacterium]|nr:hypothetical protein [Anaerolineales bacterium]